MGLWRKWFGQEPERQLILPTATYDVAALRKEIVNLAPDIWATQGSEGAQALVSLLEKTLNLEIIQLGTKREVSLEEYAKLRGRISMAQDLLSTRAAFIESEEATMQSKVEEKESEKETSKGSYVRRRSRPGASVSS